MWNDLIKRLKKNKPQPLFLGGRSILGSQASFVGLNGSISFTPEAYAQSVGVSTTTSSKKVDTRIEKKPVEVFKEIFATMPALDLADLPAKIAMVERRRRILMEDIGMSNTPDENIALMYLNSRLALVKKNKKSDGSVEAYFPWPITNTEKVAVLLKKYKLSEVSFESYYKTVPMEAIDELEAYIAEYKKYSDSRPSLRLIIDETPDRTIKEDAPSRERKKDPILIASSPFGNWWHVLGAWDKEVLVVDQLLYS